MTMITKEYLDDKFDEIKGEIVGQLSRKIDDRFDELDGKIDDLTGMTARGFKELRAEFHLNER